MVASEKVSLQLDRLIEASAGVLDIINASGTKSLTKEASAEDRKAVGQVIGEGKLMLIYQYFTQGGFGGSGSGGGSQGVF